MPTIVRRQERHRTAAAWVTANEVLHLAELGIESDTLKFKIGDGTTAWNALPYAAGGGEGTDGVNAFTRTTAGFTQPALNSTVGVTVANLSWMALGQYLFIEGGGTYQIATFNPDPHIVTLTLLAAIAEEGDGVASNAKVSPSGIPDLGGPETDPVVGAISGIVQADGAGNISAAVPSVDYVAPSDLSSLAIWDGGQDGEGWVVVTGTLISHVEQSAIRLTDLLTIDAVGTTIPALADVLLLAGGVMTGNLGFASGNGIVDDAAASSISPDSRQLFAVGEPLSLPMLDWSGTNPSNAHYWFDASNSYRLTGDGAGLTGVTAGLADGTLINDNNHYLAVNPNAKQLVALYGSVPVLDWGGANPDGVPYWFDAGNGYMLNGAGDALSGVLHPNGDPMQLALGDGSYIAAANFLATSGGTLSGDLTFSGARILDGLYGPSIKPEQRQLFAYSETVPIVDWSGSNPSTAHYYFDSINNWRLTGDGSGLTGITASANLSLGDPISGASGSGVLFMSIGGLSYDTNVTTDGWGAFTAASFHGGGDSLTFNGITLGSFGAGVIFADGAGGLVSAPGISSDFMGGITASAFTGSGDSLTFGGVSIGSLADGVVKYTAMGGLTSIAGVNGAYDVNPGGPTGSLASITVTDGLITGTSLNA